MTIIPYEISQIVKKVHVPASQDDYVVYIAVYISLPTTESVILLCSDGMHIARHVAGDEWVIEAPQGKLIDLNKCGAYVVKHDFTYDVKDYDPGVGEALINAVINNIVNDPRIRTALDIIKESGGVAKHLIIERAVFTEATVAEKARINQRLHFTVQPQPQQYPGSIVKLGFRFNPPLPNMNYLLSRLSSVAEFMEVKPIRGQHGEADAILWINLVSEAPRFRVTISSDAMKTLMKTLLAELLAELKAELENLANK